MFGNGRAGIKGTGEEKERTALSKILKPFLMIIFGTKTMSDSSKVKTRKAFKGCVVNAWGLCRTLCRKKLSRHWFQICCPPDLVQGQRPLGSSRLAYSTKSASLGAACPSGWA